MKKLIFTALIAVAVAANAQIPKNDLVVVSKTDTTTTTNTTAIYLSAGNCYYSAQASFQVRIDTVHTTGASSLAGYAVLQYSTDGTNYTSGTASTDSVSLIRGTDTSVVLTTTALHNVYTRVKIACSGTHKSRFGLAYCYKMPWINNYYKALSSVPGNKPAYNSDILWAKRNFYTDSTTLINTTSTLFSINTAGLYCGKLSAAVLVDTTGSGTMAGYMYLQGSNDNKSWTNIQTVTLTRADGVQRFSNVNTYYRYYRIKIATSGTHTTHFGYAYEVKAL